MISLLAQNAHIVAMGVAILAGVGIALTGLSRPMTQNPENEVDEPVRRFALRRSRVLFGLAATGILVVLTALLPFTPRGYNGVVFDMNGGILEQELKPGINVVIPFRQYVTNVNVQTQVFRHSDENVWQHTMDTQEIRVPIAINYSVSDASYVYSELANGPATVIQPAVLRALRTAIGRYSLEQIAPNQNQIAELIETEIGPQLLRNGVMIEFVAIEDTIPKAGILAAIEEERIANRQILTAEHRVEIAVFAAEEKRTAAKGEADALVTVALAERQRQELLGMSSDEYVLFTRWNGAYPQVLMGEGGGLILDIPAFASSSPTTTTIPTP